MIKKEEIISKLASLNQQELALLLNDIFLERSNISHNQLERNFIVVNQSRSLNNKGGFYDKPHRIPVVVGIPTDNDHGNVPYDQTKECEHCRLLVKGYKGILKCSYCYHLVEFQ